MIDPEAELRVAVAAVRAAAKVCRRVQGALVGADTLAKKDKSPVTVADFASQALVCAALARGSSVKAVVGEESAAELRTEAARELRAKVVEHVRGASGEALDEEDVLGFIDLGGVDPSRTDGRYWTLDPIDGTKGFLRGEQYAVALALIEHGVVTLAVLASPNLPGPGGAPGTLMTAVRGRGVRAMGLDDATSTHEAVGAPVHVAKIGDASKARVVESVESGHSDQGRSAEIVRRLGISEAPLRMDSQAKYAAVARGDASIYLRLPTRADYREKIWDHAAGYLVVTEAGGRVTDVDGEPLDFGRGRTLDANRGVIATCGPIHEAVLAAVAVSE
jgi:3'(2'), 5'-bisphosphate nucleotidase